MIEREISYLNLQCIHEPLHNELSRVYSDIENKQWFIQGEYVKKFEEAFATYCGVQHCIGVGNGLDAIRLILMGLGIGEGD